MERFIRPRLLPAIHDSHAIRFNQAKSVCLPDGGENVKMERGEPFAKTNANMYKQNYNTTASIIKEERLRHRNRSVNWGLAWESLSSATIGQKILRALGALRALGLMGARWLPMTISKMPIFIGRHRIPLAPKLPVLPELPCMVPDGGHPIVPSPPND
jgi:hypothetical protein